MSDDNEKLNELKDLQPILQPTTFGEEEEMLLFLENKQRMKMKQSANEENNENLIYYHLRHRRQNV